MAESTRQRTFLAGGTLAVLAVLFVAVIVLANNLLRGARIDLTANRVYTLSDGTRQVLRDIDEPIRLTFFYSDRGTADLPAIRNYATRVREMLEEMASRSGGKVRLSVVDPLPFSDEEDRATSLGVQAVPVARGGESIYFGLAGTNATDGKAVVPFLQPDQEAFLEYDVAKLIHTLAHPQKPVVGVIAGLDLGPGFDPVARRMRPPWAVYGALRELFDLRTIDPKTTKKIDDAIGTILLVHPKDLPDDLTYALDQFVMRGGHLVAFVDPSAETDTTGEDPNNPAAALTASRSSDLPKLFKAWGIAYDPSKVLLDAKYALNVQTTDGRAVRHLAILGFPRDAMNRGDIVSGTLSSVNVQTAGAVGLAAGSPLHLMPLISSSPQSALVPLSIVRAHPDPGALFQELRATGASSVVAARFTGPLPSAFPDRSEAGHLAQSRGDANLIVVADTDLLTDRFWVRVQSLFGQQTTNAFANNGDLAVNAVDNLSGSSALISVRGRATSARPFTRVQALRATAEARYRATEQTLNQELQETERKLNELQQAKGGEASLILSSEQKTELTRFRQEKVRIRKELRSVRRQLDADIEHLGSVLKFVDIAVMPILLTLLVALFARWRLRRVRPL